MADHVVARPTGPSSRKRWFPIGAWLPTYNWGSSFAPDLIAAISLATLLIPESMGYASVAGVPAQTGLYAVPLALIGYALFGGSRLLVFAAAGSVAAVSAGVITGRRQARCGPGCCRADPGRRSPSSDAHVSDSCPEGR